MFTKLLKLCLIAAWAVSAPVFASIVYTVSFHGQFQGSDLTGSVTTDGTLGALSAANIVAWSFSSAGAANMPAFAFSNLDPNAAMNCSTTCGLSATTSEIDAIAGPNSLFSFSQFSNNVSDGFGNNAAGMRWKADFLIFPTTSFIFATAQPQGSSVPEPSTVLLTAAALLGVVRLRRKHSRLPQAAAA
jgi:PEP-CTERM motif